MKKTIISSSILLLTAIIWGFAFVAQVQGMESVGTFTYNAIRFFIGTLVMVPAFFIFSRKKTNAKKFKRSMLFGLCAGMILFAAATLQQYAIEFNSDGNSMKAGFITGLYTIAVPICSLFVFKKRTSIETWISAAIAVIGLYLLCGVGQGSLHYTDILLFVSVLFWTAHILFIDKLGDSVDVFVFSGSQYAICGFLSFVGALMFDRASLNFGAISSGILPILYGGVLSVGVAYTLQFIGQKNADPTVAAIILSTESMFSAIGNLLILHVNMQPVQYVGCSLIFAGIILSQVKLKRTHKKQ